MVSLKAKIRESFGRETNILRKQGSIPAVLYGEGIKNISLQVQEKDFEEVFQEAGESSLIMLEVYPHTKGAEDTKETKNNKDRPPSGVGVNGKKYEVLIHQIAKDPLTGRFLHVDFFHPSSKKKIEAEVPLVFEGTAPAVKNLGGVLVKEIQTVEVKGLAQNLPREIEVDVGSLKSFEDRVYVKDLKTAEGVEILKEPNEIVVHVTPPTKMEEEKLVEEENPEEEVEEEKPAEEEKEEGGEGETKE